MKGKKELANQSSRKDLPLLQENENVAKFKSQNGLPP